MIAVSIGRERTGPSIDRTAAFAAGKAALDLANGRRRIRHQQPHACYVPELPHLQSSPRQLATGDTRLLDSFDSSGFFLIKNDEVVSEGAARRLPELTAHPSPSAHCPAALLEAMDSVGSGPKVDWSA